MQTIALQLSIQGSRKITLALQVAHGRLHSTPCWTNRWVCLTINHPGPAGGLWEAPQHPLLDKLLGLSDH